MARHTFRGRTGGHRTNRPLQQPGFSSLACVLNMKFGPSPHLKRVEAVWRELLWSHGESVSVASAYAAGLERDGMNFQ